MSNIRKHGDGNTYRGVRSKDSGRSDVSVGSQGSCLFCHIIIKPSMKVIYYFKDGVKIVFCPKHLANVANRKLTYLPPLHLPLREDIDLLNYLTNVLKKLVDKPLTDLRTKNTLQCVTELMDYVSIPNKSVNDLLVDARNLLKQEAEDAAKAKTSSKKPKIIDKKMP